MFPARHHFSHIHQEDANASITFSFFEILLESVTSNVALPLATRLRCLDLVRSFLRDMAQPVDEAAMREILMDEAAIRAKTGATLKPAPRAKALDPLVHMSASGGASSTAPPAISRLESTSSMPSGASGSRSTAGDDVDSAAVANAAALARAKRPRLEYLE
jgi:hypothetical protein